MTGGGFKHDQILRMRGPIGATGTTAPGQDPASRASRRVSGQFWALADDSDGEGSDEEGDALPTESPIVASPTSSDMLCESLAVGHSEEEVAALVDEVVADTDPAREGLGVADQVEVLRRIVHRCTAPSAVRPWQGPLPKVCLPG